MKRLISLFLILVLIVTGGFMGCSKGKKDVNTTNTVETDDNRGGKRKPSGQGDMSTPSVHSETDELGENEASDSNQWISGNTDQGTVSDGTVANGMDRGNTAEVPKKADIFADNGLGYDTSESIVQRESMYPEYRYWNYSGLYESHSEEYTQITEAGYQDTYAQPLSTFAIDVDTASYTKIRRDLNYGIIPGADSVRIEEMLNYFHYDYDEPEGKVPFTINAEIGICPWNEENYLLMVGIQGKNVDKDQLPKSNLVFLIDVSGSMDEPDKLPLLKSAFSGLTDILGEDDRVSIVVYASNTRVVLDSVRGSNKETILDAIDSLNASGSTGGADGIDLAYRLAEKNFIRGGNNRIILATDGDFNVGPSSVEELEEIIAKKRESGIYLSVMGFGTGNLKDNRMESLADKGNGNYSYIDSVKEARRVLVDEMAGTLLTIAKDVKIQLEFNPYRVAGYRLIGYENRALADEDFENDAVDAGELGAGHTVTAVYELIPAGASGSGKELKYQTNAEPNMQFRNEISEIKLRYKEPDGEVSREIKRVVSFENTPVNNKKPSEDYYFAAAVIEFGMLLRNSRYLGNTTTDSIMKLAEKGLGEDEDGYRLEFMKLVDYYEELTEGYKW